jgi:hypothetical protein
MRDLLNEMMQAVNSKAYYPALITAVTVPDICAALESNGYTQDDKYIAWFDANAVSYFDGFLDGAKAYFLRCAVVHQGRLSHKNFKTSFHEIMFVTDNKEFGMDFIGVVNNEGKEFLAIELKRFCAVIYTAANKWLEKIENTPAYQKNYGLFFRKGVLPTPWNDHIEIISSFQLEA